MATNETGNSVTRWIAGLKQGDEAAAQRLWERYFDRLLAVARRKLAGRPLRVADEEDVAASVFETLFRRSAEGRFPDLNDRLELWGLLIRIAERKAWNLLAEEGAQKRGGGRVVNESALQPVSGESDGGFFDQGARLGALPEPTPELALIIAEEEERLLKRLDAESDSATLRRIAQRKLEGFTHEEIAAELDCGLRTVERKLRLIRALWERELGDAAG